VKSQTTPRLLLEEMFREMVIKKDAALIAHYYHPDFVLESNGKKQDYAAFVKGHETVYASDITYAVRYDDQAWVESEDRVGARVWITTQRHDEQPVEFEVILLATYKQAKIHRVWELTWPDWTTVKAFERYSE
jgi:hypothetical protein